MQLHVLSWIPASMTVACTIAWDTSCLGLTWLTALSFGSLSSCRLPHSTAPEYLTELCFPVIIRSCWHTLRFASSNQLVVQPVKLTIFAGRAFNVSGPTVCKNLLAYLRDPTLSLDSFRRYLKTSAYYFCTLLTFRRRFSAMTVRAI